MPKETYLGPLTSAYVNTPDGPVLVERGGKLPDSLDPAELDRLKAAGTPLFDKPQTAAVGTILPPEPTTPDPEAPTLSPSGEAVADRPGPKRTTGS